MGAARTKLVEWVKWAPARWRIRLVRCAFCGHEWHERVVWDTGGGHRLEPEAFECACGGWQADAA